MPSLTKEQLRALHGGNYVARFVENQDQFRLSRLVPHMHLRVDADVVDFACGNAMLMPLVAPRVATYSGVDFSPEFILAAETHVQRTQITNASFHCADINEFCWQRPQEFDVAFAMDLSEHVYDADWLQILKSIRHSLKPGATLFLHTPNAAYLIERLKAQGVLRQFPEHIAVRDASANKALLEEAGFSSIVVSFLPHYEKRQAWVHCLRVLPVVGRLFEARLFIQCKV